MDSKKVFIRAEWKSLVMINYEVGPSILENLVPPKTEIDFYNGKTYISLIGFMFYNTRVSGIKIPWHVNFEEVNLRFYVKHNYNGEWRHGVVFINELVKLPILAISANFLYQEKYYSRPMKHSIETRDGEHTITYQWKYKNKWNVIRATGGPAKTPLVPGSKDIFISERFWGFSKASRDSSNMYRVEHPRWDQFNLKDYYLQCHFAENFGKQYGIFDGQTPDSVYVLDGSETAIFNKAKI